MHLKDIKDEKWLKLKELLISIDDSQFSIYNKYNDSEFLSLDWFRRMHPDSCFNDLTECSRNGWEELSNTKYQNY